MFSASRERAQQPNVAQCYHCGDPVPQGVTLQVCIEGKTQPMCCAGCAAVAELISNNGLSSFYRQRTAYSERPDVAQPETLQEFALYDTAEGQRNFCRELDSGATQALLLVSGINCAACSWLIEHSLQKLPGIQSCDVNLARQQLRITFDSDTQKLSEVFNQLNHLGYTALPYRESTRVAEARKQSLADLRRLAVAGIGMMQVGMFAIGLHAGDIQGMEVEFQTYLRWTSLLVASVVVFYSSRPFFTTAWRHLRAGALVMDLPVALAIGLAYAASIYATWTGTGQVYFDSIVMFTFFLLLGRFLESRARAHGLTSATELRETLPDAVTTRDESGNWSIKRRASVECGDTLLIKAGQTVPLDALILDGISAVREDTFNGEPMPRQVASGDEIFAGTTNVSSTLTAKVLRRDSETRLDELQHTLASSATHKPRLARFADQVAGRFVAAVLLIAATTFFVWLRLSPEQALWVTLSVLVISCPCALALATPTALSCAIATLRASGVLVRGEDALESLTKNTTLLLDKTGTLTQGNLSVASVVALGSQKETDILATCAALQQASSHPLARAFDNIAARSGFSRHREQAGAGMEAQHGGLRYRMGTARYCTELDPRVPCLLPPADTSLSWVALVNDTEPLAWIGLADTTRVESRQFVDWALQHGLAIELLSGDCAARTEHVAQELGIPSAYSAQTPQDKLNRVKALQASGQVVCMVGDGINDAPVLRRANTSFAVSQATDLAKVQSDFVLTRPSLHAIENTFDVAWQCRRIIRQNMGWAIAYNLCALPLAASGLVPPWMAALGMSASSLIVVCNSLRLRRPKSIRSR